MDLPPDVIIQQRLLALVIAVLISLSITWVASREGYFRIPPHLHPHDTKVHLRRLINWRLVAGAFAIFFFVELIFAPGLYLLWLFATQGAVPIAKQIQLTPLENGWMNLIGMALASAIMLWYFCSLKTESQELIWGGGVVKHRRNRVFDSLCIGAMTWFIAYPWIIVLSQAVGIIQALAFQGVHVDQVAVKHVKDAMDDPILLWTTVLGVMVVVPCLEETLFRGFLQTWLKVQYGVERAILISSLVFAAFHYSASQGLENIELLISLFILSCFLGYVRERQDSLWASIGLHSTFNTISLIMILSSTAA